MALPHAAAEVIINGLRKWKLKNRIDVTSSAENHPQTHLMIKVFG